MLGTTFFSPALCRRRRLRQPLVVLSLLNLAHSPPSLCPRYSSRPSVVAVVGCWVRRCVGFGTTLSTLRVADGEDAGGVVGVVRASHGVVVGRAQWRRRDAGKCEGQSGRCGGGYCGECISTSSRRVLTFSFAVWSPHRRRQCLAGPPCLRTSSIPFLRLFQRLIFVIPSLVRLASVCYWRLSVPGVPHLHLPSSSSS